MWCSGNITWSYYYKRNGETNRSLTDEWRITFAGIAALSVNFFWPSKESNQRKLPAAPAALKGSALTPGVVAGPADAGLW
ncbi:hypothetical protein HDF19_02480 [Mucilaginibacter sp. E4BP6]|uniref:hypothetical protein n=1 Tax=Mucilaginibacter sp. E4BP6 TaxID=2723089 RepID=UPI003B007595